jgi:hypothetical protein
VAALADMPVGRVEMTTRSLDLRADDVFQPAMVSWRSWLMRRRAAR